MATSIDKFEFDLTVKHYGHKPGKYQYYDRPDDSKPELLEKLEFKTLSAVEVIRKLLDYLY